MVSRVANKPFNSPSIATRRCTPGLSFLHSASSASISLFVEAPVCSGWLAQPTMTELNNTAVTQSKVLFILVNIKRSPYYLPGLHKQNLMLQFGFKLIDSTCESSAFDTVTHFVSQMLFFKEARSEE